MCSTCQSRRPSLEMVPSSSMNQSFSFLDTLKEPPAPLNHFCITPSLTVATAVSLSLSFTESKVTRQIRICETNGRMPAMMYYTRETECNISMEMRTRQIATMRPRSRPVSVQYPQLLIHRRIRAYSSSSRCRAWNSSRSASSPMSAKRISKSSARHST